MVFRPPRRGDQIHEKRGEREVPFRQRKKRLLLQASEKKKIFFRTATVKGEKRKGGEVQFDPNGKRDHIFTCGSSNRTNEGGERRGKKYETHPNGGDAETRWDT